MKKKKGVYRCSLCAVELSPENAYPRKGKVKYAPYCRKCNSFVAWSKLQDSKTDEELIAYRELLKFRLAWTEELIKRRKED